MLACKSHWNRANGGQKLRIKEKDRWELIATSKTRETANGGRIVIQFLEKLDVHMAIRSKARTETVQRAE